MASENIYSSDMRDRNDIVFASSSAFRLPIKVSSIYEWRILGLIMLKMQADFGDHKFNFRGRQDLINQKPLLDQIRTKKRYFSSTYRQDETEIIFPLDFLLSRDERGKLQGYDKVKKALCNLARAVEFENKNLKAKLYDQNSRDNGIIWGLTQVIEKPEIRKYNGKNYVYFRVPDSTWEVLCHWENGIHIFELSVFFKFSRPASVPFYILLADYRKKGQVIWSTKYIKDLISPNEYRDFSLFRKYVITPVQKDLKDNSPFYFEFGEFVDRECTIPARKGRGMAANYVKIDIFYQQDKNIEVDQRIDLFLEMNKLTVYRLDDLSSEERDFLYSCLSFKEIKGKNLETIVKLKYYKNYGHENIESWRDNPGNFFMEYLRRLYDSIMLNSKPIYNITAYSISAMQKELEAYEPSNKTPEQLQEHEDAPKREDNDESPSHQQDIKWLYELAQDKEWKDVMKRKFNLSHDTLLCLYVLRFRDEIICHEGHKSKQDLSLHFINCMKDGDNRDGYRSLYGNDWAAPQTTYDELKDDPLIELFNLRLSKKKDGGAILSPIQSINSK